jgi:hypothetical protein
MSNVGVKKAKSNHRTPKKNLCVEDALSVYTAMVKQDLAFESLKGVAGLLIVR